MAAEQIKSTSPFELSPITEQELKQTGVGKALVHRCEKAERESARSGVQLEIERTKREEATGKFHQVDAQCKVLETKLEVLNNRDAISQLLWGAVSIITALLIDLLKAGEWLYAAFCIAADLFLFCMALLLHGYGRKPGEGKEPPGR
jgi:hypothetical protein